MSGWSTFYFILGFVSMLVTLLSVLAFNLVFFLTCLFLTLSLFAISALFECITKILKNQEKIMKSLEFISAFQDK